MSEYKSKKATWKDGLGSTVLAILVALGIRWALIEAYVIPTGSMLPTLLIHDHIFVNKIVYGIRFPFSKTWVSRFKAPERGEVIVFRYPEDEKTFFIKRLIGVPGDKIFYDQGRLYINDQEIINETTSDSTPMDWLRDKELPGGKTLYVHSVEKLEAHSHSTLLRLGDLHQSSGPLMVPQGQYFVMGDNRDNSNDSRMWGFVPEDNLVGRAMFVWLSCEETFNSIPFLCNPSTIRFKRFFHSIN